MKFLFYKKYRDRLPEPSPNEFTELFNTQYRKILTKLAAALSRMERKLTIPQKKIALLVFCVAMLTYCYSLFMGLLSPSAADPQLFKTGTVVTPRKAHLEDSLHILWQRKMKQWRIDHPDSIFNQLK